MTPRLEKIHAGVRLQDAAKRMRDCEVGLLAVYDGDRLLGVLTDRDLVVRVVAEGLNPAETPVSAAMTPKVFRCGDHDGIQEALDEMRWKHVRRLIVCDGQGDPRGLLSVDDVAPLEGAGRSVAAVIASGHSE
jgi:signal-transduction protein with cAMP-binding, CBS, and nucleotidyltransferase domain